MSSMRRRSVVWLATLVMLSMAAPVLACLWDYDTLHDERHGLPGVAEVLAGKWERHSQFFYEQRVRKMRELIAREPGNWAGYDNLAVAYEKLGDRDSAIDVMKRKDALKPGEYTTYANLGTFYLHKGDLDNGILYIRKALEINPDAHFGREEYQLQLAEFLRDGRREPRLLKATDFLLLRDGKKLTPAEISNLLETGTTRPAETEPTTHEASEFRAKLFADLARDPDLAYVDEEHGGGEPYWAYRGSARQVRELGFKDNVFDGIVGMIRFGTGTSAELYLTLGDLLVLRGDKNLAYRAYQRALDLNHPRQNYLRAMQNSLRGMIHDTSAIQPEAIAAERAEAEAWVQAYQGYEDNLLREGKDVDDEANYAAFYRKHGRAKLTDPFLVSNYLNMKTAPYLALAALLALPVLLALTLLLALRRWRRRRALAPPFNVYDGPQTS